MAFSPVSQVDPRDALCAGTMKSLVWSHTFGPLMVLYTTVAWRKVEASTNRASRQTLVEALPLGSSSNFCPPISLPTVILKSFKGLEEVIRHLGTPLMAHISKLLSVTSSKTQGGCYNSFHAPKVSHPAQNYLEILVGCGPNHLFMISEFS